MDMTEMIGRYEELKSGGSSTEQALDALVKEYKILLRGSVEEMPDRFVRPTDKGDARVFATNRACIALLNALFSKDGEPTFEYPYYIDDSHPMQLKIHGINEGTIRGRGFVYLIADTSRFFRTPMGSWQYLKHCEKTPYHSKLEVLREDFTYPVYDVYNDIRLQ